ncbi:MAG TPA: response regulator [Candidatus Melainabacteria bacterium]|nr:response regulator [Candidatus Melainabacteria bacterium]
MEISKIMIVDDNEPDQFYARIIVRKFNENIEVIPAFDGKQALELLSDSDCNPEIIFLDINMPGMDGHDFLKKYSALSENPGVVVMLSTSKEERDRLTIEQFDCVRMHLVKPMKKEYLEMLSAENF